MSQWIQKTTHHQRLRLPTGTETMHLQEAARHRRITRILEDRFDAWGYTPVETPLVDYIDIYRPLLSEVGMRNTYRAVDRQGEIVAVRPDTTLFLAKQLGLHLCAEELPVRVWYNDQIVRTEGEDEIAGNEYQQAGLELVGSHGIEADAEVLAILQDTLGALGLTEAVIHVGSHRIIAAIGAVREMDRSALSLLDDTVRHRRELPDSLAFTGDEEELLRFIGRLDTFEQKLEHWTISADTRTAAEQLLETARLLAPAPEVRIDTSELGAFYYYTGIAFGAYHAESTAAIARGGRYDDLLGHFGFEAPSVGFSMFTRKLPVSVERREVEPGVVAPGSTIQERLAAAHAAHTRGERMHL